MSLPLPYTASSEQTYCEVLFKFASILDGKAPSKTVFALKPDNPPTQARQSVYVPQWQSRPSGTTVLACALVDITPHFLPAEPPSPTGQLTPLGRTSFNLDVGTGPPPCSETNSVAVAPLAAVASFESTHQPAMPILSDTVEAEATQISVSMPVALTSLAGESVVGDAAVSVPIVVPSLTAAGTAVNAPSANNAGTRSRRAPTERRFAIGDTVVADGAVICDGSTDNTTFTGQVRCMLGMHSRGAVELRNAPAPLVTFIHQVPS